MIDIIPFLVFAVGAFMFALSTNPKSAELGRIACFCGLFWLVYMLAGKTFHL
jgi:hypothetical protein